MGLAGVHVAHHDLEIRVRIAFNVTTSPLVTSANRVAKLYLKSYSTSCRHAKEYSFFGETDLTLVLQPVVEQSLSAHGQLNSSRAWSSLG
jgi:hypothetical protein